MPVVKAATETSVQRLDRLEEETIALRTAVQDLQLTQTRHLNMITQAYGWIDDLCEVDNQPNQSVKADMVRRIREQLNLSE